jgi:hypothetical protein
MYFKCISVLALSLKFISAQEPEICHTIACNPMHGKACTEFDGDGYILVDSCPSDLACPFIELFLPNYMSGAKQTICLETYEIKWNLEYGKIGQAMTYECSRLEEIKTLPHLVNTNEDLLCDSDSDCKLSNGETTKCTCGLNGYKYCAYGPGDQINIDRSEAACSGDKDKFALYTLRLTLDVYLHYEEIPECLIQTFPDIAWWNYLKNSGSIENLRFTSIAMWLGITLGIFLVLF